MDDSGLPKCFTSGSASTHPIDCLSKPVTTAADFTNKYLDVYQKQARLHNHKVRSELSKSSKPEDLAKASRVEEGDRLVFVVEESLVERNMGLNFSEVVHEPLMA